MPKTKKIQEAKSVYAPRTLRASGTRQSSRRHVPDVVTQPKRIFGKYIISDPAICDGKPIFDGTRITVEHVLEQVADGMSWERIGKLSHGTVSTQAIEESVRLATKTFKNHAREYALSEREVRDIEIYNRNARRLNKEALDVLKDQVIS